MQQQDNHEYPFIYQRQTCHQVQPNQSTYQKRHKCQPATFFFFNDTATTEIYTLSLHDALPILRQARMKSDGVPVSPTLFARLRANSVGRSEEHTSELQSPDHLVCRLLLEKKKIRLATKSNQIKQLIINARSAPVQRTFTKRFTT